MRDEPLEPRKLEIEFRAGLWIAVRRVETPDDNAIDGGLEITRVLIAWIAGQPATSFNGVRAARENGDSVVSRLLPLPERAVPCSADGIDRELFVIDAQLLQ